MKNFRKTLWLSSYMLSFAVLLIMSCEYTHLLKPIPSRLCETEAITYQSHIKAIIDRSCNFTGCHIAGSSAPGDFTAYRSMKPFLTDRSFKTFVIDLQDNPIQGMPPDRVENPGPKDLTEQELELVECWISGGYPE